jgi:hypothetical protein
MGGRKKSVIDEIKAKAQEIRELLIYSKTLQCDPTESRYADCVVEKALAHIELRKRVDKLLHQLAFTFITAEDIDEKEMIESIVNSLIALGLTNDVRWQRILNGALRYVNKLNGVDTRERIRQIAEEMEKVFEEGMR